MPEQLPKSSRPWRVIAEELSRETDPVMVTALARELNLALDEQQACLNKHGSLSLAGDGNSRKLDSSRRDGKGNR